MKRKYLEEDVQRALKQVIEGKSMRKASIDWGVPRSILYDRINGRTTQKEAKGPAQRLFPVQEQQLTEWILVQETLGHSPTHSQIKAFAERILTATEEAIPLGKRWMTKFLKRNPILMTKKQLKIDSIHINSATTSIIKPWFQKLQVPIIKAIKPENR
jgi:4-hydroxybenzoate polyprenyltransferase